MAVLGKLGFLKSQDELPVAHGVSSTFRAPTSRISPPAPTAGYNRYCPQWSGQPTIRTQLLVSAPGTANT